MRKFLRHNWIILTIGAALMTSMIMAIRNKAIIDKNSALQQQSVLVKALTEKILSRTIHGVDLGLRGFALTKQDNMLIPYKEAVTENEKIFVQLKSLLNEQGYEKATDLQAVEMEVAAYIALCNQMIETIKTDTTLNEVIDMLRQDRGYAVWKKYSDFSQPLNAFEDVLYQKALTNYNSAILNNLILQVCIVLLVLPALFVFVVRIRKEREARQNLLLKVEQNDRTSMFNAGTESSSDADVVIGASIKNISAASDFIKALTKGDYQVDWSGLTNENKALNENTLAGNLIDMREKLKQVKKQDEERNWLNQGLAQFSEMVRNNQGHSKELGDRCVSYLASYLNAQQCSLFVTVGEDSDRYLELTSCYAFDKKKWLQKRIEIGSGLVGQAYLEGDVVQLKDIPKDYLKITSGLGDSTPRHLVIVPLKYDVHIAGMIEMASFQYFEEYQINFLKRAGEFLGSALLSTQTTHKMKYLLEQAQITEENMRQREEEMRQNMEELQATQEELMRKEKEMQRRLAEAS